MWKEKLQKIVEEMKLYDEEINAGATMEEIQLFLEKSKTELKVDVQQNQSINGMIENNKIWYENEWQKKYLFLGESDISWYVYDLVKS